MSAVIGIDEVGRGCWAGPVVAGAVILRQPIAGLRDSKKLTAARRQVLSAQILTSADSGLGWVTPAEVDELGLTKAVGLAMQRAVDALNQPADHIIIDGNINYLPHLMGSKAIIKADDTVPAVSAASIIAKVARDNYMANAAAQFPQYGFEKHVGYGTAQHRSALAQWGVCELHRLSYKPIQALLH